VSTEYAWSADDDLTAKARIRNAALELYGAKGETSTTMREVAHAAGTTHGLIVHHFGSKDGLRRAVQQYVVDRIRQAINAVPLTGTPGEIGRARAASTARLWAGNPVLARYLRRALLDPTATATELLTLFIELTRESVHDLRAAGVITGNEPEENLILRIIMRELGPQVLGPIANELWTHLTGDSATTPAINVTITPLDPA
jgi:TetR/AcrR family transcriptional regulator, regulator of cefoperazone and chloramphenicol sensitivity